jgi:UDP-2-acetamido-3-amino-2,3-dideoxy-glucuronate N-acetyltransferase
VQHCEILESLLSSSGLEIVVEGVLLVDHPKITGENGSLIVAELGAGLPFTAQRMFALMEIPPGEARGIHAHRECEQFLICIRGSVTAIVDDGTRRQEIVLDAPNAGLYMPAMTWGTQFNYSADALLVVLASDPYDAKDYIEDYDEFVELRSSRSFKR